MCKGWDGCVYGFVNVDLVWCVVDVVFIMNYMVDIYIDIIYDYIEVIGWSVISMMDD